MLHTRSRQEKAVSEALAAMGLPHFLPLVPQVRFYGKRKLTVELPMFPSYVFLRGDREQAYAIDRTKRIASIIAVPDQAHLEWELRNIRKALAHEVPLDPYPYLKEGLRARVRSGPLKDLEGTIERKLKPDRLLLQVDLLGRAMGLEVDSSLLEVVA